MSGSTISPSTAPRTNVATSLIFEADNTAVVHNMDSTDVFPYKRPQMRKIFAAFTAMLSRHAKAKQGSAT